MDPVIVNKTENDGVLSFTLSNTNVSIANALRRTMLADIPCVVFRTIPYSENRVSVDINTSRMNNELLKQRLSCIPIHISDTSFPINNYEVYLNVSNNTDTIIHVTTKDLQIKDITTDSFVVEQERDKIFPPNPLTNDYIEIVRLRPKISDDIPGEQIKFTAKFDFGTASENGSFNVVSCSTYANTPDPVAIHDEWLAVASTLKTQGKTQEQIEFEKKDWMLLTGQRYTKPDSFDFQVETVGQYDNRNIVFRATHIMLDRIAKFRENIQVTQETVIRPSETTLAHGFDITLENEGYTLGKAIEYILYEKHYTEHKGEKTIEYCGFLKPHPHTKHSIIRLGFISQVDRTIVVNYIIDACNELEKIYNKIANAFNDSATE